MTDPRDMDDFNMTDDDRDLPDGVTEEYREVNDDDLETVGTDQTTLGESSGGTDDLNDSLDEDLTPLDDQRGG